MSTSSGLNKREAESNIESQPSIDREDEYSNIRAPVSVPVVSPPTYEESESVSELNRARIGSATFVRSTNESTTSISKLRPSSRESSKRDRLDSSPELRRRLMSQSPQREERIDVSQESEREERYLATSSARPRSSLSSTGGARPSSSRGASRTGASSRPHSQVSIRTAQKEDVEAESNFLQNPDSERKSSGSVRPETDSNDANMCGECSTMTKLAIGGGIALFVTVLSIAMIVDSIHTIDEGTVGIYFVQGALDDRISYPGVHWSTPFVTTVEEVTVRPRTDTLAPIQATTKDGIQNTFRDIQVISDVNQEKLVLLVKKFGLNFRKALVFDRVFEEVRTFCAKHTIDEVYNTMFLTMVEEVKVKVEASIDRIGLGGIKILNLAIPKPEIPQDIAQNYKQVKVQWTEQLVATQQQKTEQIKKETETIKAVLDAEREKKVLAIDIEKEVMRKEGEKDLSTLQNEIIREREQSRADVDNYKKQKAAEANQALYTDAYVKLEMAKHLSNNTKFFFSGESSIFGGLLTGLLEGKGRD